jgi:hypothetical protein
MSVGPSGYNYIMQIRLPKHREEGRELEVVIRVYNIILYLLAGLAVQPDGQTYSDA